MKFESKKDTLFTILILIINVFLIGVLIAILSNGTMETHKYWAIILILSIVYLLFWLHFGTNYELSENGLVYRSGPFKGKINLDRINEIVKGKTVWVGFKPATSRKGLIVKYDKYNEIYISPKTNESFIEKLLELKNNIKISE